MSITKELVSVIIPTQNRAAYLQEALESVAVQSYANFEIIVIVNACYDNTSQILETFKKTLKQCITILTFSQALNGAKARNIGLDKAKGEYIAFLDDDDYWHKDKLQSQVKLIKQNKYAIIGSNHYVYYNHALGSSTELRDGKGRRTAKKNIIAFQELYYHNYLGSFSFCLTKQSYLDGQRINEHLTALQDWDLWLKILQRTGLPAYIDQFPSVYFRQHEQRISTRYCLLIEAQKIFLSAWQDTLSQDSINFHQMVTMCLELREQKHYFRYVIKIPYIMRCVFYSPHRYKIKSYIEYLLLAIINRDLLRFKARLRVNLMRYTPKLLKIYHRLRP